MTDTSTAHAAALAMRDAAAALARRRPLYDGASGEPADEDLAQAIEDLPLPDVDATDWKAEAERLRAELARAREVLRGVECSYSGMLYGDDKADGPSEYTRGWGNCLTAIKSALAAKGEMGDLMSAPEVLARLRIDAASEDFEGAQLGPVAVRKLLKHIAALESDRWRQLCRIHSNRADALRRERDELSEQGAFVEQHLGVISGVLGSLEPLQIDDIAARLHLLIAERDELAARLAEIEAQKPVAWIERLTGRLATPTDEHRTRFPMVYSPLIDRPAPAAAPERAADLGENIIEAQRAQIRTLTAERDAARAELAQAREVLRYVEWLPGDLRPDEPRWCMVCMSYEPQHAPDCKLNAALAAKGE